MSLNKIILDILNILVIILGVGISFSLLEKKKIEKQLLQEIEISKKMRDEIDKLQMENKKLEEENEKLRSDIVSYLSFNDKLKDENERLKKEIEKFQKEIKDSKKKIKSLENLREKRETGERKKEKEDKKEAYSKIDELKKKIKYLEEKLKKEKALYCYNLGVAYTKAKLYKEAMEAYKKSLEINKENPEASYNLGLLYEKFKKDFLKAIHYYRKYLELKPNADDKEIVEDKIHSLLSKQLQSQLQSLE
ncbi:MAG: hypothetical protein DRP80_06995, partial [Candidatus Omnitrophota bacterium]